MVASPTVRGSLADDSGCQEYSTGKVTGATETAIIGAALHQIGAQVTKSGACVVKIKRPS
jgi:hypothetical protein